MTGRGALAAVAVAALAGCFGPAHGPGQTQDAGAADVWLRELVLPVPLYDNETHFVVEVAPGAAALLELSYTHWERLEGSNSHAWVWAEGVGGGRTEGQRGIVQKAAFVLGEDRALINVAPTGGTGHHVGPPLDHWSTLASVLQPLVVDRNLTYHIMEGVTDFVLSAPHSDGDFTITMHTKYGPGFRLVEQTWDTDLHTLLVHPNPEDWRVNAMIDVANMGYADLTQHLTIGSPFNHLLLAASGPGSSLEVSGSWDCQSRYGYGAVNALSARAFPSGDYTADVALTPATVGFHWAFLSLVELPGYPAPHGPNCI